MIYSTLAKSKKIIYVYGAGMSMALGKHSLSWSNWLMSSEKYFDAKEKERLNQLINTDLVETAGFVLKKVKEKGKYDEFMNDSFGGLTPSDESLISAVNLTIRAGDIIATTNYDTLIEQSAKIESATYKNPGEILKILNGEFNKVIHLHGIYNDDIIADREQYESIVKNEGAQFIQNLIGTYTVVFVGCGATVNDPNLSRFISFAKKHLNLDIPYFYLCKENDTVPDMPSNVVPVVYGSDYNDLPDFLNKLTQHRIRYRSGYEKIIKINPYIMPDKTLAPYGRLHFTNSFNEFTGRDNEIEKLNAFADSEEKLLWWIVTGDGGIGKSRLLLEWVKTLPSNWFGFFLKSKKIKDITPFSDTVVVIDYVLGNESVCAENIKMLISEFKKSPFKLRIVLIERHLDTKAPNNWYKSLTKSMGNYDSIEFLNHKYEEDALEIEPLTKDDEKRYVAGYLDAYFSIEPENKDKYDISVITGEIVDNFHSCLKEKYYRPLFLSIYTEMWVYKDGRLTPSNITELLELYLHREEERWLTFFNNDEDYLNSYLRLLAFASAIEIACLNSGDNGYLEEDSKKIYDLLRKSVRIGRNKPNFSELFIWEENSYTLISPEYPDIMREFIVMYYIPPEDTIKFAKAARGQSTLEFALFLHRAIEDFPEEKEFVKMAVTPPDDNGDKLEYYITLLSSVREVIEYREEIEKELLASEETEQLICAFEMELWRRMAVVLEKEPDKLEENSKKFLDYLKARKKNKDIMNMLPDVIKAYTVGFYNIKKKDQLESFLDEIINNAITDGYIATECSYSLYKLAELRDILDEPLRIRKEVEKITAISDLYPNDSDIVLNLSQTTRMYISKIMKCEMSKRISKLNRRLWEEYNNLSHTSDIKEIAGNIAVCFVNEYFEYHDKGEFNMTEFPCEVICKLHSLYEDDKDVCMAYATMTSDKFMDKVPVPKITENELRQFKLWYEKYPEEIEFSESYSKVLFIRYQYLKRNGNINEAKKVLYEMERISDNSNYNEYSEENHIKNVLDMIKGGIV